MNIIGTLFNFGGTDTLIILIVVLVIFGPKKLPELARGLRQAMDEFNKAKHEVERELTRPEVAVQPAPGQQPRQYEAPSAPAAIAPAPVAAAPAAVAPAPAPQVAVEAPQVQETHPAGQV